MNIKIQTYVFIFYNPRSGNRQGVKMQSYASQFTRLKENLTVQVQMYNLLDQKETNSAIALIATLLSSSAKLLICSAGGDGSFVSVLEAISRRGIPLQHGNIYFSVFGFGTGNDLSQSMNWGRYIPLKDTVSFDSFSKHIYRRLSGTLRHMDIWKVSIYPNGNTGYIEKAGGKGNRVTGQSSRLMSNYLTFGFQGLIGTGFEEKRRTSRLFNVFEYAKQCLLRGILGHVERLPEYISSINHNGVSYKLNDCSKRSVELIIQNLPGIWGRKIKLWDNCVCNDSILTPRANASKMSDWSVSDMSDGKLDVYALKSRGDYLIKQMECLTKRSSLQRLGQFTDKMTINCIAGTTFHMMMDGEFYTLYDIHRVEVVKVSSIKVIVG